MDMLVLAVVCCVSVNGQIADDVLTYNSLADLPGFSKDVTGQEMIVTLESGKLSGRRRAGDPRAGGTMFEADWFLGVPYAKPPIGPLRFKKPEPVEKWSGVKAANRFGSVCPQPDSYPYAAFEYRDEDCLFLNVYTPYSKVSDGPYPVMVFIHGGTNIYGTGNIYFGHLLAQHGVVVVTANYRLGMLGFFCGGEEALEGNYGLYDQIQVLQWVHDNIRQFRGDPDTVTIFGNSAGGGNVGLLAMAPPAKGLFKYVIGQSGSPLAFWCFHHPTVNVTEHAYEVGGAYSCSRDNMADMVECLRKHSWTYAPSFSGMERRSPSGADFKPCVDGFMFKDYPLKLLEGHPLNPEAYMTGTTKDEWTRNMGWFLHDLYEESPFLDASYLDGMNRETFKQAIHHVVTNRFRWPKSIVELVVNEYTTWEEQYDPVENRDQYVDLFTDISMLAPTVKLAELLTKQRVPTYLYSFNHHTAHTMPNWWKSYHTMELNFVFGSPFTGLNVDSGYAQQYYQEDRDLSKQMMIWWTNFAKYGNPSSPLNKSEWKPFHPDSADYMALTSNSSAMLTHNRYEKVRMWNHVIPDIIDQIHCKFSSDESSTSKSTWILLALCVLLVLLLIGTICFFMCKKKPEKPPPAVKV